MSPHYVNTVLETTVSTESARTRGGTLEIYPSSHRANKLEIPGKPVDSFWKWCVCPFSIAKKTT